MTTESTKLSIYDNSNNNNRNDLENFYRKNNNHNNNIDSASSDHTNNNMNVDLIRKHKKYILSTMPTLSNNYSNGLLCSSNNNNNENISQNFLREKNENLIKFTSKNVINDDESKNNKKFNDLNHKEREEANHLQDEQKQEKETNIPKENEKDYKAFVNSNGLNINSIKINEAAKRTPSSLLLSSSSNLLLNDANGYINNSNEKKEKSYNIKDDHLKIFNQQEQETASTKSDNNNSSQQPILFSSKFMNRKKSYIIMNNEIEFEQQKKQNINNKINVSKTNSTGSYSSSSSNSSITSIGVDLNRYMNSCETTTGCLKLSSSKLDMNTSKLSPASMSSISSVSSNDLEKIRQNHNEIEEDLLDETNSDYSENDNNKSNHKSVLNDSFDSDLNYDDENIESSPISSPPSSSSDSQNNCNDSTRKRKVSKSDLNTYLTSICTKNQLENENNSNQSEKNSHGKVKRIKSNYETTHTTGECDDGPDFKSYMTRTISEILTSQLTLSRKVDKMRASFLHFNKKLNEIEINMRKELFNPSSTKIKDSTNSQATVENKFKEEKHILSSKTSENLVKCELVENDMKSINNKLTNLCGLASGNSLKKPETESDNLIKLISSTQSPLTKCNSAPPPVPFLINSFIQKSQQQPTHQLRQTKHSAHNSPSSSPQKPICPTNNDQNNSSNHRRLMASMSARFHEDNNQTEKNPTTGSISASSLISHYGHHQGHHSPHIVSALNHAAAVGLNKFPYPQKDLISSSSTNQIATNPFPSTPYSQFYLNQSNSADFYNHHLHQNQSRLPLLNSNNNPNQFISPLSSASSSLSHNYHNNNHKQLTSSVSNPYHHYDSKNNSTDGNNNNNPNKTAAFAAAAAIAAAFAAKSNNAVPSSMQSSSLILNNNNLHQNMPVSSESAGNSNKDDYEYDSQDDDTMTNSQQTYNNNKDHTTAQTFNLMHHTNASAIRHIPSSAVDHLELSEEVESLVSRDLIKRCIRKAKHRGNFAANLTAELFSKEERISCNCTGTRGKRQLSPRRLNIVKEITFKIYNSNAATAAVLAAAATGNSSSAVAAANSAYQDFEEAWRKECITAIDAKNRSIGRDVIKVNNGQANNTEKHSIFNNVHQSLLNGHINVVASGLGNTNINNNFNEQRIPSPYSNSNSNHPNETSD